MISTDTTFWEDVLLAIEEGHVVPIVGRDLLVIDTPEGPKLFHRLVAEHLAADLKVSTDALPPDFDTNDVICASDRFRGDSSLFNSRTAHIVKELKVAPPEPLRLLAEIPNFGLFLSTTFDWLLEEAIFAVRGRKPAVVTFPPTSNVIDFQESLLEQNGSLVFQILGRASGSAPFAVTEGQTLELMHEFMSVPEAHKNLIARLKESHLLLMGVGFPDWLLRFLLRFARSKPLWDSRSIMEVVADNTRYQKDFALFLHHFSPQQSRLFTEGTPVDFVRELHRRWFERNPSAAQPLSSSGGSSTEKPANMTNGSIFISYASEDREAAFRLADQLGAAGLEIWVDRRINPGDDYRVLIERHIRECSAFVPVLSQNTQRDDARWFRREWELALQVAGYYFGTDRSFLFPVVVDGMPNADLIEFKRDVFRRSAARALNGNAPSEFIQQLDQAQKAWRKQFAKV